MGHRRASGRVRIIGGRWRGRKVAFPDSPGLRPTPDRVRETLFNWLTPYLEGARVLDLYAGSGILGLEALSRGAAAVTAVDSNRRVADGLRESAAGLGADGLDVKCLEALTFLKSAPERPFDLIFVDPPHADTDYDAVCRGLVSGGVTAGGTLVYIEFARKRAPVFVPPEDWACHRSGRAGDVDYQLWRCGAAGV